MAEYNDEFMSRAFDKAREALSAGEVPVGCAFVMDNSIVITEARNTVNQTRNATRHAEINALEEVERIGKERGIDPSTLLRSISVYVNVEPCIMCADALLKLKVKAVYFGCANDKFGGCGSVVDIKKQMANLDPEYEVRISSGHRGDEAIELLKNFYNGENPYAPNPKVKGVRLKKE